MRLEKRNNGGWVLIAKLAATGKECEAPFDVIQKSSGFELWAFSGENDDEMTMQDDRLTKKGVIDLAETILPMEWRS